MPRPRCSAQLPQPSQRGKDRHAVGVGVVEQPEHPLALALQVSVVDAPVGRGELHRENLNLLGRQIDRHLLLGPTQHERADPAAQPVEELGLLAGLDGLAVEVAEAVPPRVEPGRGEREEGPQVHERVLERGAGHREDEGGGQPPQGLMGLGAVVLDELRLVEDHATPADLGELRGVDAQHRIGGDDEVGAVDRLGDGLAPAAVGVRQGAHDEVGDELRGLAGPRADDARGGDDEHRPVELARLVGAGEQCQGLHGLAQAHVVGEDAPETGVPERAQPVIALELVGPQGRL